jgi:hypothetical protein
VYLLVGVVVAAVNGYFANLGAVGRVLSAVAAVLLWPIVLLGFEVQISR